jgi:hypothetical protein
MLGQCLVIPPSIIVLLYDAACRALGGAFAAIERLSLLDTRAQLGSKSRWELDFIEGKRRRWGGGSKRVPFGRDFGHQGKLDWYYFQR